MGRLFCSPVELGGYGLVRPFLTGALVKRARGDLRVSWKNLTPQPPSLRGKGEPDSLQECWGRGQSHVTHPCQSFLLGGRVIAEMDKLSCFTP